MKQLLSWMPAADVQNKVIRQQKLLRSYSAQVHTQLYKQQGREESPWVCPTKLEQKGLWTNLVVGKPQVKTSLVSSLQYKSKDINDLILEQVEKIKADFHFRTAWEGEALHRTSGRRYTCQDDQGGGLELSTSIRTKLISSKMIPSVLPRLLHAAWTFCVSRASLLPFWVLRCLNPVSNLMTPSVNDTVIKRVSAVHMTKEKASFYLSLKC